MFECKSTTEGMCVQSHYFVVPFEMLIVVYHVLSETSLLVTSPFNVSESRTAGLGKQPVECMIRMALDLVVAALYYILNTGKLYRKREEEKL